MRIGGRRPEEARVFDDCQGFHRFHTEEGETYGSFEVFWYDKQSGWEFDELDGEYSPGWYWIPGFPGCLPDGEPTGPFGSSRAAMLDADEFHPDNLEE